MKIARGHVRQLIIKIGTVQDLIGVAIACNANDRDPHGFEKAQRLLSQAFEICVEATGDYAPINLPNKSLHGTLEDSRP